MWVIFISFKLKLIGMVGYMIHCQMDFFFMWEHQPREGEPGGLVKSKSVEDFPADSNLLMKYPILKKICFGEKSRKGTMHGKEAIFTVFNQNIST